MHELNARRDPNMFMTQFESNTNNVLSYQLNVYAGFEFSTR